MEEILSILQSITLADWALAVIGGAVFAAFFNIPARRKFLSHESLSRHKAVVYDALNFLVFYMTFIFAQGFEGYLTTGNAFRLVSVSALFITYSLAFWTVLKTYMYIKDKNGTNT